MNKLKILAITTLSFTILTQITGEAMENKIKFDDKTYNLSNPESKSNKYIYLLKEENMGNWNSQLTVENIKELTNPTEAAADFAYKVQAENPGASVLVYPEAGTIGYLTYPLSKDFYEYSTAVFKKSNEGLDKLTYSRRFYSSENNGSENARKSAIEFAEKNNKKFMEMINKLNVN